MPNRSKQKGSRAERGIVELLKSYGLDAYRVPLSGSAIGFKSDVELRLPGQSLKIESKVRSGGFSRIYKWLLHSDLVVVKADRERPVAIIDLEFLAELIAQIPHKGTQSVTSKPSQDPVLSNYSIEDPSVSISIDPNSTVVTSNQPSVSVPRLAPLRVASEEDLLERDRLLEADRARYR